MIGVQAVRSRSGRFAQVYMLAQAGQAPPATEPAAAAERGRTDRLTCAASWAGTRTVP